MFLGVKMCGAVTMCVSFGVGTVSAIIVIGNIEMFCTVY